MGAVATAQSPTPTEVVDRCLADLAVGKAMLPKLSLAERIVLLEDCLTRVAQLAPEWVEAACEAKGIEADNPLRAEEIAAGPVATARHLRLLIQNYQSIAASGHIPLPAAPQRSADGTWRVQVMPVRGLFDPVAFAGFKAESWLPPGTKPEALKTLGASIKRPGPAKTVLVLGAGNVSSIPATDTISKVFQEGHVVLLKMNPVNEYLGPIFQRLFLRLVEAGIVRIIYGGAEVGSTAVAHPQVDEVHITGSIYSHDMIVWGPPGPERETRIRNNDPVLKKPISSELGNVSPWIVLPGDYSEKQLRFQAESVAASITNNASFNCVATKVVITWTGWPQRERFLDLLEEVLNQVPARRAYYPGAADRFQKFSGKQPPRDGHGRLPWTLLRNANPQSTPHLFCEESFVCVCAEFGLEAADPRSFARAAVEFANEKLWGTLSAALSVPKDFRTDPAGEECFQECLKELRYGAIGINHWPALVYAMMSPPWGGYPTGTLADAQSGIGSVHNTFQLAGVQKTVLEGPLTVSPKPFWFPTHKHPEPIAWKVLGLYVKPSVFKIPGLLLAALKG